jgi:hypothetical protein
MATIQRFEDLDVWQTARTLTNEIHALTQQDEFARDFGLRDQIQRAAVSVMSNIAEGFESRTQAVFIDLFGTGAWICRRGAIPTVRRAGPRIHQSAAV